LKDLGRLLDICCLDGQMRSVSFKILPKKQIHVLNVLLTEAVEIPNKSERRFVNSPNLSRTSVKINSSKGQKKFVSCQVY